MINILNKSVYYLLTTIFSLSFVSLTIHHSFDWSFLFLLLKTAGIYLLSEGFRWNMARFIFFLEYFLLTADHIGDVGCRSL